MGNKNNEFLEKDKVYGKVQDAASFRYLLKFTKGTRPQLVISLGILVIGSMCGILSAWYVGQLVEFGLMAKNWDKSILYAGTIIGLESLAILMIWNGRKIMARATCEFILNIRKYLFNHLQQLPMSYFDRQPQGRIVTRITHDVEGLENFFCSSLGRVVTAAISFCLAIIAMIQTNFTLGLILASMMIPAAAFAYLSRVKIRTLNREVSKSNSECNAKLSEFLNGLPVIRYFALEKWASDQYNSTVNEYRKNMLSSNIFYAFTRPPLSLLCILPMIALFYIGGMKVLAGGMSIGTFVAFIRYCERFSNPLGIILREIHIIQQAFTSAERVTTFLQADVEDDVLGINGEETKENLEGDIKFNHVSMGYTPEKEILKDISFHIKAGEKVGFVGRTGSGKTTSLSLISRLYDYQKGDILLDDINLKNYDRNFLRAEIGFVGQDVVIFQGSLRDNLLSERPATDEELLEASKLTGLYEIMEKNKMSFDFNIIGTGTNLSVGEKQLIAFTRVILSNPKVLILDEATANIDPGLESIIHQAIEKIMVNRTCLIIAHRISTLKDCDKILTFSDGQIIEVGTHQELMEQKGVFFELYEKNQTTH